MIKICSACQSTWAGGHMCEDCGGPLIDPYASEASGFPERVWSYIRLQYGARRGMIVRVLAIMAGFVVGAFLLRRAVVLGGLWKLLAATGAVLVGVATWWGMHWLSGKAVRLWVLRRGQLNKRRLARAILRKARGARR